MVSKKSGRRAMGSGLRGLQMGLFTACISVLAGSCASEDSAPTLNGIAPLTLCGNGKVDPGEDCDTTIGGATCNSATMGAYPSGVLSCAPDCFFDMRMCTDSTGATGAGGSVAVGGAGTSPGGSSVAGSSGMPINMVGTGGMMIGGGGIGGTAQGGMGPVGAAGAAPKGKMDPIIPMVSGDCPTWANGTITFMGLAGITIAAGPKPADASAPMLIYWHGTGSTAGEYAFMAAPIANGVTAAGGVIVSFQGTTGGDLNSGTLIFGASDLVLIDQFVACAVRDHNIDPRKIYTAGCSAGGLMATATAALRSNYIAAASPNSGGVTVPPAFQNAHTPPLMTVHGAMGSDVVVVDFSQTSASADTYFKGKGGFVIDCNTGAGHCGGAGLAGDAWKFFQAHPFGVDPEPWTALPAGFSSQCTIQ